MRSLSQCLLFVVLWSDAAYTVFFLQAMELKGLVHPIYDLELSSAAEGVIENIIVKEGEHVEFKQTILKLEDDLPRLDLERKQLLQQDQSQLQTMEKNLNVLQDLVQKKKSLYESTKAISTSELQRFDMQLTKAQGEFEAVHVTESKERLDVQMAQAILKQYQLQSPIQGKVIEHFKDIGEWVRSGDPLVRVMDTSTCYVEVDVEIHELANTPLGRSVDLLIPSPKGQQNITGTVTFVSPSADRGSGLVRVKVIFDNSQAKVIPGVTAVVQLPK